jgi:hypothetical protein
VNTLSGFANASSVVGCSASRLVHAYHLSKGLGTFFFRVKQSTLLALLDPRYECNTIPLRRRYYSRAKRNIPKDTKLRMQRNWVWSHSYTLFPPQEANETQEMFTQPYNSI